MQIAMLIIILYVHQSRVLDSVIINKFFSRRKSRNKIIPIKVAKKNCNTIMSVAY